jgi:MFS family permease
MMGIIGQFTTILGTMYYEAKLKDIEVRKLIYWSTVISIISGFCSLAFALRLNVKLGISDMIYVVFTDTIFGVISQAMNLLPCLALFAKVTPKRIEGTVFAFLTGATNLASTVISPLIGVWINEKFIGVTADNIGSKNYKWLCIV